MEYRILEVGKQTAVVGSQELPPPQLQHFTWILVTLYRMNRHNGLRGGKEEK